MAGETSLWKNQEWWTSRYNYEPSVREDQSFADEIELHDVTLRDGEQTPGVVFTRRDKVEIALKLDEARVHRIEAGMPRSPRRTGSRSRTSQRKQRTRGSSRSAGCAETTSTPRSIAGYRRW